MAIQVEYYSIRQDISEIELERVEIFAPIGFIKPGTICVQKPNFCVRCHQEYFSNNSIEGICPVCRLKDKHKKIIISNHSNCPRDVSGSMPEADANIDLLGEPEVLVNPESAREISGCWIPDSALSSENLFKDNDAECFHGVE